MKSSEQAIAQGTLFKILDSPLHGQVRGEQSIMDFPLFSLAKNPQMEPMVYEIDGSTIEIQPSVNGIATMWDKEILIYVLSLMCQMIERTGEAANVFTFNAHDFFRVKGLLRPSKREYDRFIEALGRLQGTQIRTNIKTGTIGTKGFFSWLPEAQAMTRPSSKGGEELMPVRVQVCDWLVRAVTRDRRIYNYHADYFRLGSVERRLYELARSQCREGQAEFELEALAVRVGTSRDPRKLKGFINKVAAEDNLPEYRVSTHVVVHELPGRDKSGRKRTSKKTIVVMTPKDQTASGRRQLAA